MHSSHEVRSGARSGGGPSRPATIARATARAGASGSIPLAIPSLIRSISPPRLETSSRRCAAASLERGDRVRLEVAQEHDHRNPSEQRRHPAPVLGRNRREVDSIRHPGGARGGAQRYLVGPGSDDEEPRFRVSLEDVGEGRDHAVMALVPLEAPDRRDQGPAIAPDTRHDLRRTGDGSAEVAAVRDQHELLGGNPKLVAVRGNLEARDRHQALGADEQRPQHPALEPTDPVPQPRGMPAAVEGDHVRDSEGPRAQHRQRGDERVVGLHVDHVGLGLGDLAPQSGREAPVAVRRPRAQRADPDAVAYLLARRARPRLGAQDLDLRAGRRQPARDLHHMALNATVPEWTPRRHHQHPRGVGRHRAIVARSDQPPGACPLGPYAAAGRSDTMDGVPGRVI